MTDTVRTPAAILALIADNSTGDISPQDLRDLYVSTRDEFIGRTVTYAYRSDAFESLAHLTGIALQQAFRVSFFDINRQSGSSGLWQLYSTTPVGTIGDIAFDGTQGLVLTGASGMFRLVGGPGLVVDIRACGILCDGSTTGQMSKLARVISAAKQRGWKLTGGGTFMATETIDMRQCQCDFTMLKIQFGTHVDATGGGGARGNFCPDGANPPSGVITHTIIDFAGSSVIYGVGIRAGGNSKNSEKHEQKFFVWGDGNFDYTTKATVIGVRWEDDDSAMAEYTCYAAYCAIGHGIQGPAEKHIIYAKTDYCEYAVFTLAGASADTLRIDLAGLNCRHYYTEAEGSETSVELHINAEARDDPHDGSPAFYIRNGKNTRLSGRLRGQNGAECILVDRGTNSGTAELWLDFETINTYGTILHVRRLRVLAGSLKTSLSRDANTAATPCPMVWLERVINAGDFSIQAYNCTNTQAGVRIGDSTLYYPIESSFGPYAIQMGNFTTFSSTGNSPTGSHPTGFIALELQKMIRGTVRMAQCAGQVIIGPNVTETHLHLPAETKRYALTRDVLSSCIIDYDGVVVPMDYPNGHTFTAYESCQSVTNLGATAKAIFNLPPAIAGIEFEFLVLDGDGIAINAATGSVIAIDTATPLTTVQSTTIYSSLRLRAADAGVWISVNGNNRAAWGTATPPANSVLPSFTPAAPIDGNTLTYVAGTWSGADTLTHEWYLDGIATGNTTTTYSTTGLVGHAIFVRDTAVNTAGTGIADSATVTIADSRQPVLIGVVGDATNNTSKVITSLVNVPVGATIVVIVSTAEAATGHAITDLASNVYTALLNGAAHTVNDLEVHAWYKENCAALSIGQTITVSWSTNSGNDTAIAFYLPTALTSAALDVAAITQETVVTAPTSGNITLAGTNEIEIGFITSLSSSFSEDPNFSSIGNTASTSGTRRIWAAYRIQATIETQDYSPNFINAADVWTGIAAFKLQ
jgi:hypothetical protein